VARVGAHIPLPGIDPKPLQKFFEAQTAAGGGGLIGLYNMFTGGALLKGADRALGIMPYISASIIFQLMTAVVPALSRLQQEGDVGRQKLTQYTRYATVVICVIQAVLLLLACKNPGKLFAGYDVNTYGQIVITEQDGRSWSPRSIFMTAGTMLLMWLGEQITQRGIGNGVSLLITVGILADIPGAAAATYQLFFAPVGVAQSRSASGGHDGRTLHRRDDGYHRRRAGSAQDPGPICQACRRQEGHGRPEFLPAAQGQLLGRHARHLRQRDLALPAADLFADRRGIQHPFLVDFANNLLRGHWSVLRLMTLLILFFSYFWVSVMFKPIQIADDLKKYGGYIPGVRPGEPTASSSTSS
jgi:preprotein translocase subunit SecY